MKNILVILLISINLYAESIDKCFDFFKSQLSYSQVTYSPVPQLSSRPQNIIDENLKELDIVRRESIGDGVNSTYLVTLSDETQAVWKIHKESRYSNYRAEVLAYEVDRSFGFNLVPETVVRKVDGKVGSLQKYHQSYELSTAPMSELDKQSFFDFLIDNRDRHGGNFIVDLDDKVISIDHGLSFTGKGSYHRTFFNRRDQINRFLKKDQGKKIMDKINNLDLKTFKLQTEVYLGKEDTNRFIKRIDFIKKYYRESILGTP